MDSPESREPNKRVNWLVSWEASLAEDAGHGESGAAGGNGAPGRRATGGGAASGGGGLRGLPEPGGAWNSLVNSPPWLCAAAGGASGCGEGGPSKNLVNSPAGAALEEGAGVLGGPGLKMRVNSPRWSASRLAGAGGVGAAGGGFSSTGGPESNVRVKSPAWSASRPGGAAGGGDGIGDGGGGTGASETSGGTGVVSTGAAGGGTNSRGDVSAIFGSDVSRFKATHSRKPENGSMGSVTA